MKTKVAFVCTGNSCRSQMAEGWAKKLGSDVLEVYSAGTHPAKEINPLALAVMREAGVDISRQYPKHLQEIPAEMDFLITMGCGVVCPFVAHKRKEDWGFEDPVGKPLEEFRKIRDEIKAKVDRLLLMLKMQ
jgi:arsenate reductase